MRAAILAALALGCAGPAAAHPHVWIEAAVAFELEDGAIHGIRQSWRFDELFSDFLIGEFDQDGDLRFSAAETARIGDEAFALLQEYDYFTDLRVDGRRVPIGAATGLAVEIDATARLVTYHFQTPPLEPVPLSGAPVRLALYDETFYVELALAPTDPVRFAGGPGCAYDLQEDPDVDLMGGLFHPQAIWLRCGAS